MVENNPQRVNQNLNGCEQFLLEVFPAEHREITRRRINALGKLRKPFDDIVEAAVQAEDKLREREQEIEESRKKRPFRQRMIEPVAEAFVRPQDELLKTEKKTEEPGKTKSLRERCIQWIPEGVKEGLKKGFQGTKDLAELRKDFEQKKAVQAQQAKPSTRHGLVGLAFSGGGIRSATFNLGLLQVLAQKGILKYIDYLSTVSGGGYMGSCLSSILNNPRTGPDGDNFPFRHEPGVEESEAFKHLRNHSNYLAPNGFLDIIRIPAVLIRGILINLLIVLPYIVVGIMVTSWLYGERLKTALHVSTFPWANFYNLTPWAGLLFLIWVGVFPLLSPLWKDKLNWRNAYEFSFVICLVIPALVALAESLPVALFYYYSYWLKGDWGEVSTWLTVFGLLTPFVTAGKAAERVSRWSGKLILYVLGLLGPLILLLLYLRLGAWIILGETLPWLGGWGVTPPYLYLGAIAVFFYTRLFVDVNSTSLHGFYRDKLSKAYLFQIDPRSPIQRNQNTIVGPCPPRAYIMPNDVQKIAGLNAEQTQAPYHLINVALNLQGSKDPNLRGRNADFFIFSKHFSGSERTGFLSTRDLENDDSHLDLGTAMAISGAAAAPNMGTTTVKPLVFIMTLLNIRLGYWLPSPYKLKQPWYRRGQLSGVKPIYLLKELFGTLHEKSWYVNVSDGGHIENLGVYELLRRRCKYIIVGDAEADPKLTFGGLATLMRYARIDMGIDIDINLDELRKKAKKRDALSRKHYAVGEIDYGGGELGYLLYIKASVTGGENEYIKEYRARNPDFPHESTTDQFFNEAQFECYRALGYHIAKDVFAPTEGVPVGPDFLEKIFEKLSSRSKSSGPNHQET